MLPAGARPIRQSSSQNSKWRSETDGSERLSIALQSTPTTFSLRKEVIQPQVLLRLPCYDFTPIMNHTLGLFD